MKYFVFCILLILIAHGTWAQQSNWLWVKASDVQNEASGSDVVVDSAGNIYVTGRFVVPSINLDSITLFSNGGYDFFVAKYDPDGKVVWAKNFGGTNSDRVNKIVLDKHGDLLICGCFISPFIVFDNDTLINHGDYDIFLAKMDTSSGNTIWAKSLHSINEDDAYVLEVDNSNSILISGNGHVLSELYIDTLVLSNSTSSVFLAKFNSDGDALWAKNYGVCIYSLCTDNTNNILLTGYFVGQCTAFGNDTLVSISGTDYYNLGGGDSYIAKLDSNGNPVKAISFGGTDHDEGKTVKCSETGSIYLAGNIFSPYIIFNTDTFYNPGVLNQICTITIKMDSAFNIQWHDEFASLCNTTMDLAVGSDNNLFLLSAGPYYSFVSNVFVVNYDTLGNFQWDNISGGHNISRGDAIAVDRQGAVVVTGSTSMPAYFDGIYFHSINYPTISANNFFLAKMDTLCSIPATLNHPEICSGDSSILHVTGTGNYLWNTGDTTASISISPAVSSTYSVTVTNDSCRGIASTTVLVYPHPVTPFVHLSGDTLYSDIPGGNQWYKDPGGLLSGANNAYYIAISPGEYYTIATDAHGCISDSSNHVYFTDVSAAELNINSGCTIFPNPSNGVINVAIQPEFKFPLSYSISNIEGKTIFSGILYYKSQTITIPEKGVYIITFHENEISFSKSIIVE